MKGSLCMCPLKLTFFLTEIFLLCEGNPLLDNEIPGSSTQNIAREEFDKIKRDIEDDIV